MTGLIHRRVAATALATVVALVLAAAPAGAKTVDPEDWAESFCVALLDWSDDISEIRDEGTEAIDDARETGELEDARTIIVDGFKRFRRVTRKARRAIRKAGDPDVENGAEISDALVAAFGELDRYLADALDDARDLPVDDREEFAASADEIETGLDRGNVALDDAFAEVERLDEGGDLERTLEDVDECAPIAGG